MANGWRSDKYFLLIKAGNQPRIYIADASDGSIVQTLIGHKYGVQACRFSSDSLHLVSCGFPHDGYIHVWNIKTGQRIAGVKISAKVRD
jgi:WD40 repeat protein